MSSGLGGFIKVELNIEENQTPPSPTFGAIKQPQDKLELSLEGMQRVGKHGKSHHEYFKVMNKHMAEKQLRKISLQQLSTHQSQSSAWLALNGIVYDVTVYLNYHPGGDILLQGCGKSCDQLFSTCDNYSDQYHPWVNGKHLLEKYKVGFLS